MTDPGETFLDVRLIRRVHAALTIDVAFSLGRECGVIFGPSGSGKTTPLRLGRRARSAVGGDGPARTARRSSTPTPS